MNFTKFISSSQGDQLYYIRSQFKSLFNNDVFFEFVFYNNLYKNGSFVGTTFNCIINKNNSSNFRICVDDQFSIKVESFYENDLKYFQFYTTYQAIKNNIYSIFKTYGMMNLLPIKFNVATKSREPTLGFEPSLIIPFSEPDKCVECQLKFVLKGTVVFINFNLAHDIVFKFSYRLHPDDIPYDKTISGTDFHELIEECIYDIYLKDTYSLSARDNDNLTIAEMMAF